VVIEKLVPCMAGSGDGLRGSVRRGGQIRLRRKMNSTGSYFAVVAYGYEG